MAGLNPRISAKDDRGRTVRLDAMQVAASARESADDPGLADLRLRIWKLIKPDQGLNARVTWRTLVLIVGGCVIMGAAIATSQIFPMLPQWMLMVLSIVGCFLLGAVLSTNELSQESNRIIAAFLREGRCPCCGYVIAGSRPEPDGLIACPECSAAWKPDRIGPADEGPAQVRQYRAALHKPTPLQRLLDPIRIPLVIADQRGQAVHIIDPLLRRIGPAAADHIGLAKVQRIRTQVRRVNRNRRFTALLGAAWMVFFAVMMLRAPFSGGSMLDVLFGIGKFALFAWLLWSALIGAWNVFFSDRALSGQRTANVLLNNLICPGCCEPLDDVTPDGQSVCQCPTCHAVWHVPRHPAAPG